MYNIEREAVVFMYFFMCVDAWRTARSHTPTPPSHLTQKNKYAILCAYINTICIYIWGGGPSGTRGAAGRRLRRPLGSRRRLRPHASRYIPGSSP